MYNHVLFLHLFL